MDAREAIDAMQKIMPEDAFHPMAFGYDRDGVTLSFRRAQVGPNTLPDSVEVKASTYDEALRALKALLGELGYVTRAQLEVELETDVSQHPDYFAQCFERSPRDKSRCRREAGHEGRHTSRNDGWYKQVEDTSVKP